MTNSRRTFLKYVSAAPAVIGSMGSSLSLFSEPALANVTPTANIGSIGTNDPATYLNFANWFGRKPQLTHLYFNQNSPQALSSSINYICQQGAAFMADGAQILWSVPTPGPKQLEAIVAGSFDSLYTTLFQSVLAVSPNDTTPIMVRLPWEFNLAWQTNAPINLHGSYNPSLFILAWRQIATIAKGVSPRFYRIWCPNVCTNSYDPVDMWPNQGYVECISQDFYMQSAYDQPGFFNAWYLNQARGLAWGAAYAKTKVKPYGLSEWGMDSDQFVGDLNNAATWLGGLGKAVNHHCWWDRPDGIDCRISDGTHPGLAGAYKNQFY